jgi:hypothetical protein
MAFATTRTIGSGSSCAAASHGRLALPHESEAVNHAWSRRASKRDSERLLLFQVAIANRSEEGAAVGNSTVCMEHVNNEARIGSCEATVAPVRHALRVLQGTPIAVLLDSALVGANVPAVAPVPNANVESLNVVNPFLHLLDRRHNPIVSSSRATSEDAPATVLARDRTHAPLALPR